MRRRWRRKRKSRKKSRRRGRKRRGQRKRRRRGNGNVMLYSAKISQNGDSDRKPQTVDKLFP